MLAFGISGLPPDGVDDEVFLDSVAEAGHRAYELAFVHGFPWKEDRCERFGALAEARNIRLSIHAPYFAILTSDDPEKAVHTRSALEHTMKLGKAMGARVVVAHTGYTRGRTAEELHALAVANLEVIEPKVRHLGVALGLETTGTERAFGTLGDIALIASEFGFVRPVVDWAYVHAMSGNGLTTVEAFESVIAFLRSEFPGWAVDPLHCQFTDNLFGPKGEIRHVPYGEGTLRVGPLVEAAVRTGLQMTLISEAHDDASHQRIHAEVEAALAGARPDPPREGTRPLASGVITFPAGVRLAPDGDGWAPVGAVHPLRITNPDKVFFPADGYTKGDLLQYYASIAPLLLPHLEGRAIVMSRYPDGADGDSFYEKQAPSHRPDWLPVAPLWSEHRGEPIEFVTAPDVDSLLWIVNLGAIEIHPWLTKAADPGRPTQAIFDLDPAEGADWEQVVTVAGLVRLVLQRLGLEGHPKTSGATGIHVYVPLDPIHDYARVRAFVEAVGRMIVAAAPDVATMEWDIGSRTGRVFIDHNQNVGGKTIASVYSVRPRPGAPVSTPLVWDELDEILPDHLTLATIWDRVARFGDLFSPLLEGTQRLEAAEEALGID
ncbi:MAG: non-homologous end-joining DNA ligase [Actinobacteria bacterium]|nr:non-homologous end-joining DNA ligase [Actinomycetota bacterium]